MQFLSIFSVLQVALCADPIRFLGSPTAKSSDFDSNTILYDNPISPQINSTQFLYEIITKESSVDVGLATVYLNGHGNKIELQNKFSVINQNCTCYWLSAVNLKERFSYLNSGTEYFISIESDKFNVRSGTLGLNFKSVISPSTSSDQSTVTSITEPSTRFSSSSSSISKPIENSSSSVSKSTGKSSSVSKSIDDSSAGTSTNSNKPASQTPGSSPDNSSGALNNPSLIISIVVSLITLL